MTDVVYVAIVLAFYGACALYINWCDRMIEPDGGLGGPADDRIIDDRTDAATPVDAQSGTADAEARP
jgi:hypothetical protein